ncbi:hypothetical protein SteCoe_35560 [Stentor coeruleus]|uniref:Uncharacterized protein n=1 Tax=Stentor coeruleus TaxID=5963 RepID=A0A1R2AS53_9CILI|nr:hypothetical protein SteCoe_35560 [Stentor coeruleus]
MIKCNFCLNFATFTCSTNQTHICENCLKTEDSCEFSKNSSIFTPVIYSINSENLSKVQKQISHRLKILSEYKEKLIENTQSLIKYLINSHNKIAKKLDKKENDLKNIQKKNNLSVDEYKQALDLLYTNFDIKNFDCKKICKCIEKQYNSCEILENYIVDNFYTEGIKQKCFRNLNLLRIEKYNPNLIEISKEHSMIFLGKKNVIQVHSLDFSNLICELKEDNYFVTCLKLSKCNNFLVSGYSNGMIILWNIKNYCLDKKFSQVKNPILFAIISVDLSYIVSINTKSADFLDVKNNKIIFHYESQCFFCLISPNSKNVLFSLHDSKISIFDMETKSIKDIFDRHTSNPTSLFITNDNLNTLSRSENEIILWSIADKKSLANIVCVDIISLDISMDNNYFVFGLYNNKILLWDIKTNKVINETKTREPVFFVAFFDDDKNILLALINGEIWIINTSTFKTSLLNHTENKITDLQITLDSKHMVVSYENKMIIVFDLKNIGIILSFQFEKPILSICLSCNLTFLALGSSDSTLTIYSLQEKRIDSVLKKHNGSVYCLAISSDDSLIVSGSSDLSIRIWNLFDDNYNDNNSLVGHKAKITCIVITNDNRMIVSASEDQTIIVWGLLDRKLRSIISGYDFPIRKLIVSKDDRYTYTPCAFGVVKVWDLFEEVEMPDIVVYDIDTVKKVLSLYPEAQSFFREAFVLSL